MNVSTVVLFLCGLIAISNCNVVFYSTGVEEDGSDSPFGVMDKHYIIREFSDYVDNRVNDPPSRGKLSEGSDFPVSLLIVNNSNTRELTWGPDLSTPVPLVDLTVETVAYVSPAVMLNTLQVILQTGGNSDLIGAMVNDQPAGVALPNSVDLSSGNWQHGVNKISLTFRNAGVFSFSVSPLIDFSDANVGIPCDDFTVVQEGEEVPEGFRSLSDVGLNGLYLDLEGKVVLSDPSAVDGDVLSVGATFVGDELCITVVDCNNAGTGGVLAQISNTGSDGEGRYLSAFVALDEVCSNAGVHFGCVDTRSRGGEVSLDVLNSDFGDELDVIYNSNNSNQTAIAQAWLTCPATQYWSYEEVSDLLLRDSLTRNVEKLQKLRQKVVQAQDILFDSEVRCEDIGQVLNLAPTAISSFEFLECLGNREDDAKEFLERITPVD